MTGDRPQIREQTQKLGSDECQVESEGVGQSCVSWCGQGGPLREADS